MLKARRSSGDNEKRKEVLQQLFPEAFDNEGFDLGIFERILNELDFVRREEYNFSWAGKQEAIRESFKPAVGVLKPVHKESIDFSSTRNVFVEGDNLEVLRVLSNTMENSVKMIYIDPPYNTNSGQNFYEDDFTIRKREYKSEGHSTNHSISYKSGLSSYGRFHSRWLSMMYPRMQIARRLLSEDGVLFVSLDDVEVLNLALIMKEIFGEKNVETMIWKKVDSNEGKLKLIKRFRVEHEYILVGYKNKDDTQFKKVRELPDFRNEVENVDQDPRGEWVSGNMSSTEEISVEGGKNFYEVVSPGGRKFRRQWKFPRAEFDRLNEEHRIYWGKNGNNVPRLKVFANEPRLVYVSSIVERKGTAKKASSDIRELVGTDCFPNPKPVELIRYLIDAAQTQNGIIMDFFAGSGTTAQAVLEQNAIDGGNRSFFLVELPKPLAEHETDISKMKFQTSADVTKFRIKAAIKKFKNEEKTVNNIDLGMKVFALSRD